MLTIDTIINIEVSIDTFYDIPMRSIDTGVEWE
jgi:hypothetical protein